MRDLPVFIRLKYSTYKKSQKIEVSVNFGVITGICRLSMADNTGFSIRGYSAILVFITRKIPVFCRTLLSRAANIEIKLSKRMFGTSKKK